MRRLRGECTEQSVNVLKTIVHRHYDDDTMENDIAILKLAKPLVFNKYVQPACLPDKTYSYPTGENLIISGWGSLVEGGGSPNILNVAYVPLITNDDCNKYYRHITNDMFCAGFKNGQCVFLERRGGVEQHQ